MKSLTRGQCSQSRVNSEISAILKALHRPGCDLVHPSKSEGVWLNLSKGGEMAQKEETVVTLTRRVRTGAYVVDSQAVADAMLKRLTMATLRGS